MNVRKSIKKILAVGTGLVVFASSIMGAFAGSMDLKDYPNMFIKDGQFDATIVIGDNAAAEDVVGAVDIGASLQFALAQPVDVAIQSPRLPDGDVVEFSDASDLLEMRERIGDVRETFTDSSLKGLTSGTITTDEGQTRFNQYLRFEEGKKDEWINIGNIPSGKVVYAEDENDVVGDYLFFNDGDVIFEYELEFERGLESQITTGNDLKDLEDERVVILGQAFTIVDTDVNVATNSIVMEFMAGESMDTLEEGQCKLYTIDNFDYDVCTLIISDSKRGGEGTVKFSVNGEITDEMDDGDTDILKDGLTIGVREIIPNEAEEVAGGDIVEFFLGAYKLQLSDSDYTDGDFDSGGVEINDENIEDGMVMIQGSEFGTSKFEIQNIKYRLTADAIDGDVFIADGGKLSSYLDEPTGMLTDNWDIHYGGIDDVSLSEIRLDASGDERYSLKFENRGNLVYDFDLIDNSNGKGNGFKYGEDDSNLFFRECNENEPLVAGVNAAFCINEDDMFVLTDDNDETGFTNVLRYENIDTGNNEIIVTDLGAGQREFTYDPTAAVDIDGQLGKGNMVVSGNTFEFWVGNITNSYNLAIDLNHNGVLDDADKSVIVSKGGYIMDLGNQCSNGLLTMNGKPITTTSNNTVCLDEDFVDMSFTTLASEFDEAGPNNLGTDEVILTRLSATAGNEVDLEVYDAFNCVNETAPDAATARYINNGTTSCFDDEKKIDVLNLASLRDEDIDEGYSSYGTFWQVLDGKDDAAEIKIEYPEQQRGVTVYIAAGPVKDVVRASGDAYTLNPIGVGSARLASEIEGKEKEMNLILVGGPCINPATAIIMGFDQPVCGSDSGINPGESIVRLYQDSGKVSMVVAGYNKEDTRKASKVVTDYKTHLTNVSGDYIVVGGTSVNDLDITVPK